MDDEVVLDVVDDGAGFEPSQVRASGHGGYGLSVMRARAEALGGRLTVESQPGGGTAVAATFPLDGVVR
jgi:signal transduction histidine kinase